MRGEKAVISFTSPHVSRVHGHVHISMLIFVQRQPLSFPIPPPQREKRIKMVQPDVTKKEGKVNDV